MLELVLLRLQGLPNDLGVERRLSSIPDAGDGLWATRDFMAGDLVAFYGGQTTPAESAERTMDGGKLLRTENGQLLDGTLDASWISANPLALGQFANHPPNGELPNVMTAALPLGIMELFDGSDDQEALRLLKQWTPSDVVQGKEPIAFFVATADIAAGDELLLDYSFDTYATPDWYTPVDYGAR